MKRLLAPVLLAAVALAGHGRAGPPGPAADAPPATLPTTAPAGMKVGYVGLLTVEASPALRAQLGLPAGVGVVVMAVDPDSPAARAGVAVHDVITRMDEQILVNPPQFSVIVRLRPPGLPVRLDVVRHGRPMSLAVAPVEQIVAEEIGPARPPPRLTNVVSFSDGTHVVTISVRGDDQHVRIAARDGATLYEGPLNTPADHEKLPADLRGKIEAVEQHFHRVRDLRAGSNPDGATP